MKKLLCFLLLAMPALAQVGSGIAFQKMPGNWIQVIPLAQVSVYTAAGLSSPAVLFTDRTLTAQQTGNIVTADVYGNYTFYAPAGVYYVCVSGGSNNRCDYVTSGGGNFTSSTLILPDGSIWTPSGLTSLNFTFSGAGQSTLSLGDNTSVTVLPSGELTFGPLNGVPNAWFGSTSLGRIETGSLEGQANGIASLNGSGVVPVAQLATNPGSCNGSTFLAGNNTCATPGGGGGGTSWPLAFSSGANVANNSTNYLGVGTTATSASNGVGTQWPVPRAGTVGPGFYCRSSQVLTSTMQYVLTMRKGLAATGAITSSAQAITCTISGGGTTASCNDATHTFTVAAGDVIDVQDVPSNTPTAANLNCSVVFQ